jgi:heme/copper-type cytochrome/quinol oxidase subunit 3
MGGGSVTQLGLLGFGLLVLSVTMFIAHLGMKKTDQMRIKGLPQVFDRESHPAFFEVWEKTAAWSAIIALILGIAFLAMQL